MMQITAARDHQSVLRERRKEQRHTTVASETRFLSGGCITDRIETDERTGDTEVITGDFMICG